MSEGWHTHTHTAATKASHKATSLTLTSDLSSPPTPPHPHTPRIINARRIVWWSRQAARGTRRPNIINARHLDIGAARAGSRGYGAAVMLYTGCVSKHRTLRILTVMEHKKQFWNSLIIRFKMLHFLTMFWSWDRCCWSMSKDDHFPIISFV